MSENANTNPLASPSKTKSKIINPFRNQEPTPINPFEATNLNNLSTYNLKFNQTIPPTITPIKNMNLKQTITQKPNSNHTQYNIPSPLHQSQAHHNILSSTSTPSPTVSPSITLKHTRHNKCI
jgi:hypothetical protein